MIKTTILTGTEQEVTFAGTHKYYWVQCLSGGDILAAFEPDLAADKDDVLIVPNGGTGRIHNDFGKKTIYLSGTGKVQVIGTNNAFPPSFKAGSKGGGEVTSEGGTVTGTVDYPIVSLNLYGKSVQDGTPTPDAPIDIASVGDDGSVEVAACGKNLANARLSIYFNASSYELDANSLSVTSNTGYGCAGATLFTNLIVGKKYTLSLTVTGFEYDFADGYLVVFNKTLNTNTGANLDTMWENNYIIWTAPSGKQQITFTAKTNTVGITLLRSRGGSNTETVTISATDIQLTPSITTATEFEQYKGNTAFITSGLPLCSVGDVRDELIYNADGTGKIIKRTAKLDSYNGETITTDYISSTGGLDTGAEVVYVLENPIEIELSAAEMAEFMQLQTYNGVTNIFNDNGAEMKVKVATNPLLAEYVKPVIEGISARYEARIAALEAAITNT